MRFPFTEICFADNPALRADATQVSDNGAVLRLYFRSTNGAGGEEAVVKVFGAAADLAAYQRIAAAINAETKAKQAAA